VAKAGPERGAKSKAIRELLEAQPNATMQDIQSGLEQKGIQASTALIAKIKYSGKGKRGRKRKGAKGKRAATAMATNGRRKKVSASGQSISLDHLLAAKKLIEQVGSVEAAQSAVQVFAKLSAGQS